MIILHGDNTVSSRKELEILKEKNKEKEIVVLNGKVLSLTDLKEALEAKSLFGIDKLIIIENILFKLRTKDLGLRTRDQGLRTKNLELEYLLEKAGSENLVLWEGKEINKGILSLFKNARIKIFKIEKLIFSLVESLRPGNSKVIINLFRECLSNNPPEIIFSMIVRQFRLLILVKSGAKNGPDELKKIASWQKQRLTNQAKFFTMERLREIYQKLLDIDYKNKTGRLVYNLEKTLEIFLVEI